MNSRKSLHPQFVVCVDNSGYPASLELHKLYRALPDPAAAEDGDVRVIDESGEDYLYPAEYFVEVEVPRRAADVITKSFNRGTPQAA